MTVYKCVQAGDTIQSIAQHYSATWLEIYAVNPKAAAPPRVLVLHRSRWIDGSGRTDVETERWLDGR